MARRILWPRSLKYGIAVALITVATGANLLLGKLMEPSSAPLLFAAVLVASWQGGWGPGVLATILAALIDDYFFIAPIGSIDLNTPVIIRFGVFLSVSLLTSYLTSRLRAAVSERDQLLILEREARVAAESANAMKDRFLAVTSHELRTPLSAILLWADLLAKEQLSDDAREGVETIRQCAEGQRRLIEDLLDVVRLRIGKLRLELEPVDLGIVVKQAAAAVCPLITPKDIQLSLSIDETARLTVWADRVRLQQILVNLLGNAAKFTAPGGSIRVEVGRTGPVSSTIRVIDNGRGIEPQNLSRIFDQFWQAGDTKKTAGDGLGMGLAIVHDLVKLHKGQIHAVSEGLNRGTTFIVELPLMPAEPMAEALRRQAV